MRFGRYEIVRKIGQGGMAEILLARIAGDGGFVRHVALKRMLPALTADRAFVRAFSEEARVMLKLNHAHIAAVYEVGQVGDTPFLAMEYVQGIDLRTFLQQRKTLPLGAAMRIASDIAGALAHAHGQSVVHRDVSPANVLVSFDGIAKLADFGIAKAADRAGETTRGSTIKGKYSYLSPEQIQKQSLDARVDMFAFGTMLYEMLSVHPFRRPTELATLNAIMKESPPPLDVPAPVNALIARALDKDRAARFPDMRTLIQSLDAACLDSKIVRLHTDVAAQIEAARAAAAPPASPSDEVTR